MKIAKMQKFKLKLKASSDGNSISPEALHLHFKIELPPSNLRGLFGINDHTCGTGTTRTAGTTTAGIARQGSPTSIHSIL